MLCNSGLHWVGARTSRKRVSSSQALAGVCSLLHSVQPVHFTDTLGTARARGFLFLLSSALPLERQGRPERAGALPGGQYGRSTVKKELQWVRRRAEDEQQVWGFQPGAATRLAVPFGTNVAGTRTVTGTERPAACARPSRSPGKHCADLRP